MALTGLVNQYKNRVLNIAVIIIALIIAVNIYKSQARAIAALRESKDTELKKNTVLTSLSLSEKDINHYKEVINKKSISSVINKIGNIANEAGVKITSLRPEQEAVKDYYLKYPFALSVKAKTYHEIGRFISKLEAHPDIYMVELIEIKNEAEESQGKGLVADIKVSTVLLPQ